MTISNPTNKDTSPDPVEMLYIISPSISLLEFREQIQKLLAEERIDEISKIPDYGFEEPTDYACYDLNHQFNKCVKCYKEQRIYLLQTNTQNKEEKE